jgi:hypothetical protein
MSRKVQDIFVLSIFNFLYYTIPCWFCQHSFCPDFINLLFAAVFRFVFSSFVGKFR